MSCCKETGDRKGLMPGCTPDEAFMAHAVTLARRGKGDTAPNPCVGAVLVRQGAAAAEGYHTACGKPHAEPEAIADARERGVDLHECTLYVTLEPCNHQGRTPPCTRAILNAGIKKVVIGCLDPNPDVAGGGAQFLRDHGVEVVTGVLEEDCRNLIDDFIIWKTTSRTYNTLKMASTLDGRIAARSGKPEPVSSPESFERVHEMRRVTDAVIVGGATLRADNPSLTCRAPGFPKNGPHPWAVIAASRLPSPDDPLTLLRDRPDQVVFWTTERTAGAEAARDLEAMGCRVWGLPKMKEDSAKRLDLSKGFERLRTELGCWCTLCEGGGTLAGSMLEQGLIDEFSLFLAPRVLGDSQGKPLFTGRTVNSMADTLNMRIIDLDHSGPDLHITLKPEREE